MAELLVLSLFAVLALFAVPALFAMCRSGVRRNR
jgi:Tfp pilus assembly protein FimT